MDKIAKASSSAKKFWNRYKAPVLITYGAVTTAVIVIQRTGIAQHDTFLKDKGLYDEFYTPEES